MCAKDAQGGSAKRKKNTVPERPSLEEFNPLPGVSYTTQPEHRHRGRRALDWGVVVFGKKMEIFFRCFLAFDHLLHPHFTSKIRELNWMEKNVENSEKLRVFVRPAEPGFFFLLLGKRNEGRLFVQPDLSGLILMDHMRYDILIVC